MKRTVRKWLGAVGFAMLSAWSGAGFAQTVSCSGNLCFYGPICPDGWGGCYYYTWYIGSANNQWTEEKSKLSSIVKNCDLSNPDTCVLLESKVELVQNQGYNALAFCSVPGGRTCNNPSKCGGSSDSSGNKFLNVTYSETKLDPLDPNSCSKADKSPGGVRCTKLNEISGPIGDPNLCANPNWIVSDWWPLNFLATTRVQGPKSNTEIYPLVGFTDVSHCVLKDQNWRLPSDPDYALSSNVNENHLVCTVCQPGSPLPCPQAQP